MVLVVRARFHLIPCSARSLREQLEAVENDHDLALVGSPETHGHRLPKLRSVWPTDQERKFLYTVRQVWHGRIFARSIKICVVYRRCP